MECLYHEQRLTECPRPLPQDLVRLHWDDRAKGKDERVNVLHIEVVGRHGIGYRVIGQTLRRSSDQHQYNVIGTKIFSSIMHTVDFEMSCDTMPKEENFSTFYKTKYINWPTPGDITRE